MIEFIYTNKLSETKGAEDLLQYLVTADKFQVPSFSEACMAELTKPETLSLEFATNALELCESLHHLDVLKPLLKKCGDVLVQEVKVRIFGTQQQNINCACRILMPSGGHLNS